MMLPNILCSTLIRSKGVTASMRTAPSGSVRVALCSNETEASSSAERCHSASIDQLPKPIASGGCSPGGTTICSSVKTEIKLRELSPTPTMTFSQGAKSNSLGICLPLKKRGRACGEDFDHRVFYPGRSHRNVKLISCGDHLQKWVPIVWTSLDGTEPRPTSFKPSISQCSVSLRAIIVAELCSTRGTNLMPCGWIRHLAVSANWATVKGYDHCSQK